MRFGGSWRFLLFCCGLLGTTFVSQATRTAPPLPPAPANVCGFPAASLPCIEQPVVGDLIVRGRSSQPDKTTVDVGGRVHKCRKTKDDRFVCYVGSPLGGHDVVNIHLGGGLPVPVQVQGVCGSVPAPCLDRPKEKETRVTVELPAAGSYYVVVDPYWGSHQWSATQVRRDRHCGL